MPLTVTPYKSSAELARAHPNKTFQIIHHAPRGQSVESHLIALRKKNTTGQIYQVGDFFWQEIPRCTCQTDWENCPQHPVMEKTP